ncbi:hypothetical protein [Fodinicola feengrottensis]|nr:hypothetical protein [Fodinicola feengrottensis]
MEPPAQPRSVDPYAPPPATDRRSADPYLVDQRVVPAPPYPPNNSEPRT